MAMPAPCSAFAVALYPRVTRSSQMTINAVPVIRPIAARIAGRNQPCSTEYFRKKIAARTSATPAIQENSLTPINDSQSNGCLGCFGAAGGRAGGGCGGGGGAAALGSGGGGAATGVGAGLGGGGWGAGAAGFGISCATLGAGSPRDRNSATSRPRASRAVLRLSPSRRALLARDEASIAMINATMASAPEKTTEQL